MTINGANSPRSPGSSSGRAYILQNVVTHKRFIPVSHNFMYNTLSILVSLTDLEESNLDIGGGWIFGYGSNFNVCGIRPQAYLAASSKPRVTIREKLDTLLAGRGYRSEEISDVWLATMPSFLGFEGINPLTVHYVYKKAVREDLPDTLWLVVLEVHNTFGEKHVYVLETGAAEEKSETTRTGFDHSWLFPRQFHVSPFNDRSGFYRCTIRAISPPSASARLPPPKPIIKLDLITTTNERKSVAIMNTASATPLTAPSLLFRIAQAPFALLLTSPRIIFQAFRLHYGKRLDVYPRPEPVSHLAETEALLEPDTNPIEGGIRGVTGALGWQDESPLERWAKRKVETFLEKQRPSDISVILISSNSSTPPMHFSSPTLEAKEELTIAYRSPKFWTTMIMAPSAEHALILGSDGERLFKPSSREKFLKLFSFTCNVDKRTSLVQAIRLAIIPQAVLAKYPIDPSTSNPLDRTSTSLSAIALVCLIAFVDWVEAAAFWLTGTRFVVGTEPWNAWNRLAKAEEEGTETVLARRSEIGSVLRE